LAWAAERSKGDGLKEEVLIIGGGPAGAASAMNLLREGFQPVIIEAEIFPRFHIGESLTTECVDALSRLGLDQQLEELSAPRKTGVRIFSKNPENSFFVGAGDAWQVERSRFDKMMLDQAIERGARLLCGRVTSIRHHEGNWKLAVRTDKGEEELAARFVIDASGQQRFSQKRGLFGEAIEGDYARQISFYSQFEGVARNDSDGFDTLIFHREHHEWAWMIPLSESVTSIGLVVPVEDFRKSELSKEDFLEQGLAAFSEPLKLRAHAVSQVGEVGAVSNYSFSINEYSQNGLFCVGDSHRFIDPIFSFGVQFAVVEAEYVAKAIAACAEQKCAAWQPIHDDYMKTTTAAQDVIQDLLSYFWAYPWGFANMAHQRYPEEFLEIFAGRIYEVEAGEGLTHIRKALT